MLLILKKKNGYAYKNAQPYQETCIITIFHIPVVQSDMSIVLLSFLLFYWK